MTLQDLQGTRWSGPNELWLDPLGNEAITSDGSIEVAANAITYQWSHEGKDHTGTLALRPGGVDFSDSFHAKTVISLESVPGSWALVDALGTWSQEGGPAWGWRVMVSRRPDTDELVLQMTIIAPWGEDGRAVRMICRRS